MFNHSKKPPISPRSTSSHPLPKDGHKHSAATKSRIRSASAGRSPNTDLRTRYWTFLFENLHRAVDEIYQTCETDESIVECKEAIMMLENYTKEFHALIEWFHLNNTYENTPPPNRPTSLSWEVRKSSPGKAMLWSMFFDKAASPANLKHSKKSGLVSTAVQTAADELGVSPNPELAFTKEKLLESVESLLSTGTDLCFFNSKPSLKIRISPFPEEKEPLMSAEVAIVQKPAHKELPTMPEVQQPPPSQPISSLRSLCEAAVARAGCESSDLGQPIPAPYPGTPSEPALANNVKPQEVAELKEIGIALEVNVKPQEVVELKENIITPKADVKPQEVVELKEITIAPKADVKSQEVAKLKEIAIAHKADVKSQEVAELKGTTNSHKANVKPQVEKSMPTESPKKIAGVQKFNHRDIGKSLPEPKLVHPTRTPHNQTGPRYNRTPAPQTVGKESKKPTPKLRYSLTNRSQVEPREQRQNKDVRRNSLPVVKKQPVKKSDVPVKSELSRGSTLSLCSNQSWADKVKGVGAKSRSALDLKASPDLPVQLPLSRSNCSSFLKPDDDSDGWEMVRGRTRSRNSPGKTNGLMSTVPGRTKPPTLAELKQPIGQSKMRTSHAACLVKKEYQPSSFTPLRNDGSRKPLVKTTPSPNKKEPMQKPNNTKTTQPPKKVLIEGSNHLNKKNSTPQVNKKKVEQLNKANHDPKPKAEKSLIIMDFIKNATPVLEPETPTKKSSKKPLERKNGDKLQASDPEDEVKENKKLEEEEEEEMKELTFIKCEEEEDEEKVHSNSEELPLGLSDELEAILSNSESLSGSQTGDWYEQLEAQEQVHQLGLSWGEQMDHLDLELRTPGRALHLHEKLSSPYRKRSLSETLKRQEERQLKAQEQRERLLEEKAQRFKGIQKKMEEMKAWKEEQQLQRRMTMEKKLQRAEEKRLKQLQMIVRKAHDEEEKVNEIAFINTLEAQNKRHDILSKEKDHEARLLDIQEERQRKLEEKAAKEAAAEERRRALEAERKARLQEMQEKRKLRDLKIEQQLQEKEKERLELANQKARDREQRLSALTAAQQATAEELQKKIHLKQVKSARRHEENMEQIRQRAFELSVRRCSSNNDDAPCLFPYETKKMCTLCNVVMTSEVYLLSHLRGKQHQAAIQSHHQDRQPLSPEELEAYNLQHIVDAAPADLPDPEVTEDRERQKALRKRCKKLRQRINARASEIEGVHQSPTDWENKHKLGRAIKLCKLGETAIDRPLGELQRHFARSPTLQDRMGFVQLGGVSALVGLLGNSAFPQRIQNRACEVLLLVTQDCPQSSLAFTPLFTSLLDCLASLLSELVPEETAVEPLVGHLLRLVSQVLPCASVPCLQDLLSYTVAIGVVDKMADYLQRVQGPLDNTPQVAKMVSYCLGFLTTLVKVASRMTGAEDSTQLLATCHATELVRIVPLLYAMLLHGGAPCRKGQPPALPPHTLEVVQGALCLLTHLARLNLPLTQGVLGREGLSLQLRHVASYLLWYCGSHGGSQGLLHELVLLLGYFAVLCPDNQGVVHCGQSPTVLQQLCSLPFQYFSDPALTQVLFPTLVSCCYPNPLHREVLRGEMSPDLLANYIEGSLLDVHHSAILSKAKGISKSEDLRWDLSSRFPKSSWTEAKKFFSLQT